MKSTSRIFNDAFKNRAPSLPPIFDTAFDNDPAYRCGLINHELGDGQQVGSVLITTRSVKQGVFDGLQLQFSQQRCSRFTYAIH
jgi:hypothetical protein